MDARELYVVPGDRHVERLAREGLGAETRASLRSRLAAALLPDTAFADARECRLVLAIALSDEGAPAAAQLALFDAPSPDVAARPARNAASQGDALLAAVRARGGASWARLVAALDDAIALLRARGATVDDLDRVARTKGFLAARARTLSTAMRGLDERLAKADAKDARLAGALVAIAIARTPVDELEAIIGARRVRARWVLGWEPADVAWWRALDDKLSSDGGGARVLLPAFDRPLAGARERDPLDALADEVVRGLDAPAESEMITPVLGDLTGISDPDLPSRIDASRVRVIGASDVVAQARAVASVVATALEKGAAVERIAIAFPSLDERTLAPLRRALEEAAIVSYEARGSLPSSAPVVSAALLALDAAATLDRHVVARLLRSGWVSGARVSGDDGRVTARRLSRLARSLETSATSAGKDAAERLVRTATTRAASLRARGHDDSNVERERDATLATQLADILSRARAVATRLEHVRATRALWSELGIGARAGRGALAAFTSDGVPMGVPRAERLAVARDARAWDSLVSALDLYETTTQRVSAAQQPIDADTFRLELIELLDGAASQPGAARSGAIRISRLADVAGEALDLLVVMDASEGILPRDDTRDALVSESLGEAIGRASRGVFVPPAPGAVRARELTALAVAASEAGAVVLTFAREDASGAPLAASSVVTALERAGITIETTEAAPPRRSGANVTLRVAREREREAFFLDPRRPLSDVIGDLAPAAASASLLLGETGGSDRPLAVTGLERFARCAFMGYAHVVLAARETESKDELPDAREEGTLIHEALAAAFLATRELWSHRPRSSEIIVEHGARAADAVLDRWQGHAPLRAIVRLRVSDAVRAVLEAAVTDDAFDFAHAEQTFGSSAADGWPALELEQGDARLLLRGSIDRIDRGHDGLSLRVIDYKRSKSTVAASASALGETALQVPLYACVASRVLELPATGAYVPTQARDVAAAKPNKNAAQRMDELVARSGRAELSEIERRALSVVSSVRAGALAPIPASEAECRFCAVSGGCRKPRFAMAPLDDADDDHDAARPPRDAP